MTKLMLTAALSLLLFSCSEEPKPVSTEEVKVEKAPPVDLPYKATYSSDWSIGDPNYTKIALDFYKALEADNIDSMSQYFEDSVQFKSYDNRTVMVSRDEMFRLVKKFRSKFTTLSEEFPAFVCLHSNDRNEDWVSLWINETGILLNGKADSTRYQENWRFRNSKVYYVADFARYSK